MIAVGEMHEGVSVNGKSSKGWRAGAACAVSETPLYLQNTGHARSIILCSIILCCDE